MFKSFAAVATLGATVSAQISTDSNTIKMTTTPLPDANITTEFEAITTTVNALGLYSVSANY